MCQLGDEVRRKEGKLDSAGLFFKLTEHNYTSLITTH